MEDGALERSGGGFDVFGHEDRRADADDDRPVAHRGQDSRHSLQRDPADGDDRHGDGRSDRLDELRAQAGFISARRARKDRADADVRGAVRDGRLRLSATLVEV